MTDSTIRNDTGHRDLIRELLGRPLWEMQPEDADTYFGRVLRDAKPATRTGRAAALTVYFQFLELLCTCQAEPRGVSAHRGAGGPMARAGGLVDSVGARSARGGRRV